MSNSSVQESILKTIEILVDEKVKNVGYTASSIGKVVAINLPSCTVKLVDNEIKCTIPEHLHDWIGLDDIVIVQDLYNDMTNKAVVGKVGSTRPASFVMYDQEIGKGVSGVDATENQETGEVSQEVILELE